MAASSPCFAGADEPFGRRHQRICDIHATFHTCGRRGRTNDIANAPFWSLTLAHN